MVSRKLLIATLFNIICYSHSYRILVCFPLPIKSLNLLGAAAVRHLLNNGHEVTYITTHPVDKLQNKNFRQIDVHNNVMFENEQYSIGYLLKNKINSIDVQQTQGIMIDNAKTFFQNDKIINLLNDPNEHFDAVIVDLIETEVYAGLAVLYNCPMIWLYSMGAHWQVLRLIADASNPAYDPDYLGTNIPPFSFTQRVEELWARVKWNYYKTYVSMPVEQKIYEQTFEPLVAKRGGVLPDYTEVIYNSSLIFGNEHNAVMYKPSTPQNFKYVGGLHVQDPVKVLPKDLQNLMDNSSQGVIYFSMGSFFKSKTWPKEFTRSLLNIFGELKQTVIWKYEVALQDLPKNVHIVHWAPQQSILAHPNCKFFITHGGMLSSIESVHFGVPIIGIPVWFDQIINIIKAQTHGYALKVDFNNDMPQNLKSAITIMLNDQKYRKKVKELSSIYHDRLVKPGAEFVHWVEHVIRTGGAPHLRSPAIKVPLYQRLYLDLLAVVMGILYIIYISLLKIVKQFSKNVTKIKKQ